jgi:glycerophosphoryl diester phosphodiesterase
MQKQFTRWILAGLAGAAMMFHTGCCARCASGIPPTDTSGMSLRDRLDGFSVAAHQGGVLHLDKNTIRRFERARRSGADIVEMDLRLTADGVPVVYHDEHVRVANLFRGPEIAKTPLERLRRHRVWGQRIPTFEEVLQWSAGRIVINAEFKERDVVVPAVALARQYGAHDWVYFQCKSDPERYALARATDPAIPLLYKPADDADLDWALGLNDDNLLVIELGENMRRPGVVARVHAAGKLASYNAWRLDRLYEIPGAVCDKVFALGIDIAVTNRPACCACQREAP